MTDRRSYSFLHHTFPPSPAPSDAVTRSFTHHFLDRKVLINASAHWDPGEPGSLSYSPGWYVDNIEAFDPVTGDDLTSRFTPQQLQQAVDYRVCWPTRPNK